MVALSPRTAVGSLGLSASLCLYRDRSVTTGRSPFLIAYLPLKVLRLPNNALPVRKLSNYTAKIALFFGRDENCYTLRKPTDEVFPA